MHYIPLRAGIDLAPYVVAQLALWSAHSAPPHTASSQTVTRTRCQRRASSALVADTAVRTFGGMGVLGRVPSGSREGRVPSACITFFGSWSYPNWKEPALHAERVRFRLALASLRERACSVGRSTQVQLHSRATKSRDSTEVVGLVPCRECHLRCTLHTTCYMPALIG